MNGEQIWQAAQEELRFQLSKPSYETWLKNASLVGREKNAFKIGVPTKLAKDWLEDRYSAMIKETLSAIVSGDVSVAFEVVPGQTEASSSRSAVAVAEEPPPEVEEEEPVLHEASQLNPKFQFQHFVVGNNSRFAHAACRAVAETPAKAYNPLFLYGGVGLGKTHLANAIGHETLERQSQARIAYLSAETFMTQLINALRRDRMDEFKGMFRKIDVLILDDVQFLANRERTQEEFFHTFNALHEQRHQIVLTSDKVPKDITGLEERLRNRFEWGLIADIQPPDMETRVAILEKKAEIEGLDLSRDVAVFLASHIDSNVRELEGSLTRLSAVASLSKTPITVDFARTVLKDLLRDRRTITIEAIQASVCDHYGIRIGDLLSQKRTRDIVGPRQVAMYLARKLTTSSYPAIGERFGNRDHSTVIHGFTTVTQKLAEDGALRSAIEQIEHRLQGKS